MTTKYCKRCIKDKPVCEFTPRRSGNGYYTYCRDCANKISKTNLSRKMSREAADPEHVKRRRMAEEIEFNRQFKDDFPLDY